MSNRHTNAPPTYYTSEEAAKVLGLSVYHIKRLRLAGQLAHYRPSKRRVLFTREHLEEFRTRREVRALAA